MKKEIVEYEIGKRHLANMMGKDPECFTQADINVCKYIKKSLYLINQFNTISELTSKAM